MKENSASNETLNHSNIEQIWHYIYPSEILTKRE